MTLPKAFSVSTGWVNALRAIPDTVSIAAKPA